MNIPPSSVPTRDYCDCYRFELKVAVLFYLDTLAKKVIDGLVSLGFHVWPFVQVSQVVKSTQGDNIVGIFAFFVGLSIFLCLIGLPTFSSGL